MSKKTLHIFRDKWYPVFVIEEDKPWPWANFWATDIPEETLQRWRETFAAFEKVQDEIRKVIGV